MLFTCALCGAHPLERVGEMKSQKIQKGGFSDSVDKKGGWVKRVEQGWGLDPTPNIGEKWELAEKDATHRCSTQFYRRAVCSSNTSQNMLISAQYHVHFIPFIEHCVLTKFWLKANSWY